MKVLVVAREFPYPPVHGGLMDTWNRIVALSRRGVAVHLISWTDEPIAGEHLDHLRVRLASVEVHARNRAYIRALHPKYPTGVISRIPPRVLYAAELERTRRISPEVVFLDGLEGAVLAISLAADLGVPLVYRSHNVEHQYMRDMFRAARPSVRKALLLSNAWRTRWVEREVRRSSSLVYDISAQDRDAWRDDRRVAETKVLNYYLLHSEEDLVSDDESSRDIDLLYVGNLNANNNVFGLIWFAREVAPLLGGLRVVVAGSKPTPKLRELMQKAGIELLADPREVRPLYKRARVLMNPVWHGSGLNIKMVELLATGRPVVSTTAGTRGLIEPVLAFVKVADEPEAFTKAVRAGLNAASSSEQRQTVIGEYGWENVDALISDLHRISEMPARRITDMRSGIEGPRVRQEARNASHE